MKLANRSTTRDTCVCWSISSLTKARYPERSDRHGNTRAARGYHASKIAETRGKSGISGPAGDVPKEGEPARGVVRMVISPLGSLAVRSTPRVAYPAMGVLDAVAVSTACPVAGSNLWNTHHG